MAAYYRFSSDRGASIKIPRLGLTRELWISKFDLRKL